jgi:3-oxoacyl-[acyl-carrier-protein] synthase-1
MRRVYITGIGLITSIGNDVPTVTQNLRALRHGFELYPPFQKPDIPVKVVGTIKDFVTDSTDPEDWLYPPRYTIKREVLRGLAPNSLYAYCSMLQAVDDARLAPEDVSNRDTGLFAASGGSPFLTHYHHARMLQVGVMRCSPLGIVASIAGTLNFNLVATFKILGASCGFSSACASSSHALGFAYDEIALGRQKRMFVVGAEDCNTDSILPFAGMRALSLQTSPDLASRPFDVRRDGFVGTGGGAVLVVESEDEVERRGARTYCEIAGWGQASDGYNVAISHPEGTGLRAAMNNALRQTGIEPEAVDYVNAHATSTPIGDTSEAKALAAVFKEASMRPAVSSTKALTGHGLSLSGAMETAFCALALKEGFIPGSAHIANLDPSCEGLNVIRATLSQQPRLVLNNSSGFGGANVCIVLRQA